MTNGWRMATVSRLRGGLPERVTLCGSSIAVVATGPKRVTGARVWTSGERFDLPNGTAPGARPRTDYATAPMKPNPDGAWILLVSDTRGRPTTVRVNGVEVPAQVHYSAGLMGEGHVPVSLDARRKLARAIEGAEDRQPRNRDAEPPDGFVDVHWPPTGPTVIGRRRWVTKSLTMGQPIWVKVKWAGPTSEVTDIRLSQSWRDLGAGAVSERLGRAAPCRDPKRLCPSCRVFGSAEEDERRSDEVVTGPTEQLSYAGHVRFFDAVAVTEPTIDLHTCAPLSTPKPSAGQFYLDNGNHENEAATSPLAHWGSAADTPVRPIRGRKFYWATTADGPGGMPASERHRAKPSTHHNSTQTSTVEVVHAGAEFTTKVTFDNLAPDQIGAVLASIDPNLLWPTGEHVFRLGGGRPFGWGAVTARIAGDTFVVETATSRYLGGDDQPVPSLADCVAAFAGTAPVAGRTELQHLLTLDYVADADVHYPADLDDPFGEPTFDFWTNTRGQRADGRERPLTSLPSAALPPAQQKMNLRGPH